MLISCSFDDHKKRDPPLGPLDVDHIKDFVLEILHLVYIGVVKRFFEFLGFGKSRKSPNSIGVDQQIELNAWVVELEKYIPSNFSRRMTNGIDIASLEASEHRLAVLYSGLAILSHSCVPQDIYDNFRDLCVGMRFLVSEGEEAAMREGEFVEQLLRRFIKTAEVSFSDIFYCQNVHSLIHLPDDYLLQS